jgi:ribosomal protein L22
VRHCHLYSLECSPSSNSPLRRRRSRHQSRKKSVLHLDVQPKTHVIVWCRSAARARGEYLRTHFKNMREVAAALTGQCLSHGNGDNINPMIDSGLKLTKAYTYLSDVSDHKQIIPFRRFAGGVGRASQAKQFKATQGASRDISQVDCKDLTLAICYRSLAREIRQVHHSPFEKCRVERRFKEPRARGPLHQEHWCPASTRTCILL